MLAVLAWMVVLLGIVTIRGTERERHHAELRRILSWVMRAHVSKPATLNDNEWHNITGAVHNAAYNPLSRPTLVPTEKIRALADELDATQGADFATVESVMRLYTRLEEICPAAKGYGPFESVRQEYGGAPTPSK